VLLAELTEFAHVQSFLQGLLVLVGKIVDALAFGAFKLDHVVL
jgi:hypothetical protein